MNYEMIDSYLSEMSRDEQFYKEYDSAKKANSLDAFLKKQDPEDLKRRRLIVPELWPEAIPEAMLDEEYFDSESSNSVYLSKHNRYTPAFEHTHVFFEIIYVLKGSATHHIFGENMILEEGDLCLVSPSVTHAISVMDDDSIIINILMRRRTMEDIFYNVLRDNSIISSFFMNSLYMKQHANYLLFHTGSDSETRSAILDMYMEQMEQDDFSDRIISSMLIIFFTKLVRKYKKSVEVPPMMKVNARTADFFPYIMDHYQTVTLKELADHLGYSVPYCSLYIREATGYPFSQLLKKLRFEKALSMLQNTNMSIQAVSEQVGYGNPENFMRAFKKTFHMTPTEYRKQPLKEHRSNN